MNKFAAATALLGAAIGCAPARAIFIPNGATVGESFAHSYLFVDDMGGVDAIAVQILFDGSGLGFNAPAMDVTAQPAVGGWGFDGAGGGFALISGPDMMASTPGPTGTIGFDVRFAGEADAMTMEALFDLQYRLWAYDDGAAVRGSEWKNFDLATRPPGSDPSLDVDFAGGTLFRAIDLTLAPDFDEIVRTVPAPGSVAAIGVGLAGAGLRRRRA